MLAQHQTWLCFRRWRAFSRSRLLASFRDCVLLSNRIRIVVENVAKMASRIHRETHNLDKNRRCFHSFLEILSFGNKSIGWFVVSTYLIWILSNNQSRATLWVLDMCLIVGFRPLIIILMTNATLLEKDVCWWLHNPQQTIDQPSAFFC